MMIALEPTAPIELVGEATVQLDTLKVLQGLMRARFAAAAADNNNTRPLTDVKRASAELGDVPCTQ